MTTVAILGTGKMGGAMGRRLAASGFDLTLWNRTPGKARELGIGQVAATPADAVRDAEIVISSLTNEAAVREVYLGDAGVLRTAAGKLIIDASTAGPRVAEDLGREAQAAGVRFLEAPVVGSVPAVESGKLLILVAGDRSDLEQARPVLEKLGDIQYAGAWGNAQRLKLIANSMLGITSSAAAELLVAGTDLSVEELATAIAARGGMTSLAPRQRSQPRWPHRLAAGGHSTTARRCVTRQRSLFS